MDKNLKMLDTVALLRDHPEHGLVAGDVGVIVEIWKPGVFEVEFSDDMGQTIVMDAFLEEELLRLKFSSDRQAVIA